MRAAAFAAAVAFVTLAATAGWLLASSNAKGAESRLGGTPLTRAAEADQAAVTWALDAIHRRSPADEGHTLKARVLAKDFSAWMEHAGSKASHRGWYAHQLSYSPVKRPWNASMQLVIPAEDLPLALAIAQDPYAWLAEPPQPAPLPPRAQPLFVTVNLSHANDAFARQFTGIIVTLMAALALAATAALTVRAVNGGGRAQVTPPTGAG